MKKTKEIMLLLALLLVLALLLEWVLPMVFPQHSLWGHIPVPLCFGLFYSLAVVFVGQPASQALLAKRFMLLKSVKILLSLFLLLAVVFVVHAQAKVVVITFLFYYIVMLLPESLYLMHLKKNNE